MKKTSRHGSSRGRRSTFSATIIEDADVFPGGTMPIARLAKDGAFAPEDIALLTRVFEDACRTVGLTDPTDRWRDIIAKTIIEAAQRGERDPDRLRECGMRMMK